MNLMGVMANTEMWVGLITDATAGRNGTITIEAGFACFETFRIHVT
jgi:hypothetical protein